MASFLKQLEHFLQAAAYKGLVDAKQANSLLALAREREGDRGVLNLAAVLGRLGGAVLLVGVILLVGHNWDDIPDGVKIGGLIALLAATHGLGFWIRHVGLPLEKTAETLHFVGGGLFLAGIALVAQIYHLDGRPPNGLLLWLVAIAPLAALLRSAPLTVLSVGALLAWLHLEGSCEGSLLRMSETLSSHFALEIGIGAALIGLSPLLREREPGIAHAFRALGAFFFFGCLYLLGFYRYFSYLQARETASIVLPMAALAAGGAALAAGGRDLVPDFPWLRNRLLVLLGAFLVLAGAAVAADAGLLYRGGTVSQWNFGWSESFDVMSWILTGAAWLLWFLLALWCVAFGTQSGRRSYVNLGVAAFGLGVVTRFFDLMGGLAETGFLFLAGGTILIVTAWAMEKWRRSLLRKMPQAGGTPSP